MNSKFSLISFLFVLLLGLSACGGGDVSEFSDDDIPSPVGGGVDGVDPSNPGSDPVDGETLANLPQVNAGNRIFADPNVLVTLNGSAVAAEGATIATTIWTQVSGPSVVIPNANQLSTSIVIPDLLEDALLVFRLTAVDSQGRINSATVNIQVAPSPAFARVIGEVAGVGQESVVFTVRLNSAQANDVTINYATQDGTAIAGIDYLATSGSLVIAAGQTQAQITVPILPTTVDGVDASFVMRITVIASDGQNNTSNVGVVLLRDTPDIAGIAPILAVSEPFVFLLGEAIEPFSITNQGGGNLTSCAPAGESSLPRGLSVDLAEDLSTCVISGTPLAVQAALPIDVVATNEFGSGSVTLNIEISATLPAPVLADLVAPILRVGVPMEPLAFVNTGGGNVSCAFEPVDGEGAIAPEWLNLTASEGGDTCVLSGTPTEVDIFSGVVVSASNEAGTDTAGLDFEVREVLLPPDLVPVSGVVLALGIPMEPLVLVNNGGGELTQCAGAGTGFPLGIDIGISSDGSTCVISGTPSEVNLGISAAIFATNDAGESDLFVITIAVTAAPVFVQAEDQTFFVGEVGQSVDLVLNEGAELDSCLTVETLPPGLSIAVNQNLNGCTISGEPAAITASAVYTVRATNIAGSGDVIVNIEVVDLQETVDLVLGTSDGVCSIGVATNGGIVTVDWNDGSEQEQINNQNVDEIDAAELGALEHIFVDEPGGDVSLTFSRGIESLTGFADNGCAYNMAVSDFAGATDMEVLKLTGLNGNLDGGLAELSANHPLLRDLEVVRVPQASVPPVFSGALTDLPPNLERFSTQAGIDLAFGGSLDDVPASLEVLELSQVGGSVGGSIDAIPGALVSISISDSVQIGGDLTNLKPEMERLELTSFNQVVGDLSTIKNNVGLILNLQTQQTAVTGIVSEIPSSVMSLTLSGFAEIRGNIEDLHPDMQVFNILSGETVITGDIGGIQNNGTIEISVGGRNTISGDIANLPLSVVSLNIQGDNTIGGDIGLMQANNLVELAIGGQNQLLTFSRSPTWSPSRLQVFELTGGGLTVAGGPVGYPATDVDALLIHLNSQIPPLSNPGSEAFISVERPGDQPATAASAAAITELQAKGFEVLAAGGFGGET